MARWFKRDRTEKRAISFQDVWGSGADTLASRPDNMNTALRLIPVYAANRLLSETIASLPLQQFRKVGNERRQMDLSPLFEDPTAYGTCHEWKQRAVTSLALRGNGYGYITEYDDDVFPRRIEWLHPDEVSLSDNRAVASPRWFWLGREIDPSRIVHIPGQVLPGLILGLSPISYYAATIDTGLLAKEFGRDWFKNGSIPAAVIEGQGKLSEGGATKIKAAFRRAAKYREPVALGGDFKYRPITVPPNESQFLATMQATVNEIASIYGIPAERIGGTSGSSRTYANREQDSLDFVTYSLGPYLTKLETAFSRLLPPDQYVKFNVDALVRADLKTRYEAHDLALKGGWLSRDEVRRLEDLPPLPDGLGKAYALAPSAVPAPEPQQQRGHVAQLRAAVPETRVAEATRVLTEFFARQRDVIQERAETHRASEVFDLDHWNAELIPLMLSMSQQISKQAARSTMRKIGINPDVYDEALTLAWHAAQASRVASAVNRTTEEQVSTAMEAKSPKAEIAAVFAAAISARAPMIAQTEATAAAGFGSKEAATQSGQPVNKMWVTGSSPRSSHASMSGETVPIEDTFSNGARWPGDSVLPDEERANCNCQMDIVSD